MKLFSIQHLTISSFSNSQRAFRSFFGQVIKLLILSLASEIADRQNV